MEIRRYPRRRKLFDSLPMFDPYHKWLGIPKEQRPPSFYQLLGISPTEQDPDVIEEAAIRQTTHVRAYQIGTHAAECTRILNEIAQARQVLVAPAKRKAYDATLAKNPKTGLPKQVPLSEARHMVVAAPPVPQRTGFEDLDDASLGRSPGRGGAPSVGNKGLVMGVSVGALVLAVVGLVVFVLSRGGGEPEDNKDDMPPIARNKDPEIVPQLPDPEPKKQDPFEVEPKKKDPIKPDPPKPPDPGPPLIAKGGDRSELLHQENDRNRRFPHALVSPDEKKILLLEGNRLALSPLERWDIAERFVVNEPIYRCLAFTPDGRRVLLLKRATVKDEEDRTYQSDEVLVWNVEQAKIEQRYGGQKSAIDAVAFSPDGQSVLTSGHKFLVRDNKVERHTSHVCIWNLATGRERQRWEDEPILTAASFSPDGSKLYLATQKGQIRERDLVTAKERTLFSHPRRHFAVSAFSPNGRYLLARTDLDLQHFTLEPFPAGPVQRWPQYYPQSVAVSGDSRFALVGVGSVDPKRGDCFAALVELATGRELARTAPVSRMMLTVNLSATGRYGLTRDSDGNRLLWRFQTERAPAAVKIDPIDPPKKEDHPKIAKLVPIPEEAVRKEKEKEILDQYKKEFAKKAPADRAALAERLLTVGTLERNDMAARYVLLCQARDLAGQAGKTELALKAVDELTHDFVIDPLEARYTALAGVAKGPLTKDGARDLLEAALAAASEAMAAEQFPLAFQFLGMAKAAANRTPNPATFNTQVLKHEKYVRDTAKEYDDMKAATATLEKDPANAQANLAAGRYLSLRKGDWDKGLPLLARGGDGPLPELARKDLKRPADARERADLGDQWWAVADKDTSGVKPALHGRAVYWYRQALPQITGLAHERAAKRVKDLEDQPAPFKVLDPLGELRRFKGHPGGVTSLMLSPDGKRLLSGGLDATIRTADVGTAKLLVTLPVGLQVQSFAMSPDQRYLLVSSGSYLRVVDARTGKPAPRFADRQALGATWGDDALILYFTRDTFQTWNFTQLSGSSGPLRDTVRTLVFSPKLDWALALETSGSVLFYEMVGMGGRIPGRSVPIDAVSAAFSADSSRVACGTKDGAIYVIEGATRRGASPAAVDNLKPWKGHAGPVRCLAFSPNGQRLLSGGADKTVCLWDVKSGKELHRFALHTDAVLALVFAADGRSAFSASADGTIRQWSLPREK